MHWRPVAEVLLTYALVCIVTTGGILWVSCWSHIDPISLRDLRSPDILLQSRLRPSQLAQWLLSGLAALPLAILNSLLLHRLGLFVHAAAHGEFAATRRQSDRLFNVLIAWFFGMSLADYRRVHFAHHRLLGQPGDPEDQYTAPFSAKRIWLVLRSRDSLKRDAPAAERNVFQPISKVVHLGILLLLSVVRDPAYAFVVWAVPILIGLPLVTYVRNYCEHHPSPGQVVVSRNFSSGIDAFFLGAAGFRHHHEHHERPSERYWRLSSNKPSSSYIATFFGLLRQKETRVEHA